MVLACGTQKKNIFHPQLLTISHYVGYYGNMLWLLLLNKKKYKEIKP
jgi:hypothetical protein